MEHPAGVQSGLQTGSQQPPPPPEPECSANLMEHPAGVQSGPQTGSQQPPPPPDLNAVPTSWNTQQGYKVDSRLDLSSLLHHLT